MVLFCSLSWLCGAKAPDQPVAAARRYNRVRADLAESILTRAKAAGFGAIVLTVDSANKYGWRTEELESGYLIQHDARCALRPHESRTLHTVLFEWSAQHGQ